MVKNCYKHKNENIVFTIEEEKKTVCYKQCF